MDDTRLRQADRQQYSFNPACLDDLLPPNHPARVILRAVASLDLSAFKVALKARHGFSGRDATDPLILITLWLWATTDGQFSARRIAKLCLRDDVYRWILGGVTVNHRLLSDFRTDHADALDRLFTQVLEILHGKGIVKIKRISQDGLRVRASAGTSSFRREPTLNDLHVQAQEHVKQLRELFEDEKRSAELSARQKAMRKRAAKERKQRVEEALELVKKLQIKQDESGTRKSEKQREKQQPVRASTTDAEATRMKMGDGGFRPAYNVQLAADTDSRAIVGVDVSSVGNDYGLAGPMRDQVEDRLKDKVEEHLVDGGYLSNIELEKAEAQSATMFVPPKTPKDPTKNGDAFTPKPGDTEPMKRLRERMAKEESKEIYKQRASTIETVNADVRCRRGLRELTVRGLKKVRCVALWSALAYNFMHFGVAMIEKS